ncbi:MAG: methyltransferase domain-containing protein [Candidatus Latescibacteria bacterium]|nr:methyltransferase domain-containing protein [Candidatus Latescibacterota bacterium]
MEAYHGAFYDSYFCGVEGDVEFYVEEALESGGPVLEIGCGTGRVLLPSLRAGVEMVGLEPAPGQLAVLRQKVADLPPEEARRLQLVEGVVEEFDLGRTFPLITIPYRTFQHLLTPVDQRDALQRLHHHLQGDGLLVFNTFDPLQDMVAGGWRQPLRKDTDFIDPTNGHQVIVWYSRIYDPEVQLMEQELVYEAVDGAGISVGRTVGRLTLRWSGRLEMEYLLGMCGFAVEALYGDFDGAPYPGYGEQVWVARKL